MVTQDEIEQRREHLNSLMDNSLLETVVKVGYELGLLHAQGHPAMLRMQDEEGHLGIVALATKLGLDFERKHVKTDWLEKDFIIECDEFVEKWLNDLHDMSEYIIDYQDEHAQARYVKMCVSIKENQLACPPRKEEGCK